LYDNEKLIGTGIFDEGEISGAGNMYFFDHEYRRYGIGKYLIILILEYLVANNFTYYYVGFIFIGHLKLDYKLSVEKSGIEYYDPESDKWNLYYR
jgi:arginyl-tRNA--protein-N-Asp/Glu arginylyltransferase